jgi:putative FmdB family regulatory protein
VGEVVPIYEYRCGACGLQKEFLQRLSDAPLRDCPECGKPELAKLMSAAGFQLKGTGWYATDFKSSGAKPAAKAKQDKSTETKQDKSTETKQDKSTETKQDKSTETKQDKSTETKQGKSAESSGGDGPKTNSSKAGAASGAGTGPACS